MALAGITLWLTVLAFPEGRQTLSPRSARAMMLLLFLGAFPSLFAQEPAKDTPQGPAIRVDVRQVSVGVSVTDSRGQFIKGLRRGDFKVFDNGAEQPITSFVSDEGSSQIVLLMENSAGLTLLARAGNSPYLAADQLLSRLSPSAQIAIVTYSKNAKVALPFTGDRVVVRRALKDLHIKLLSSGAASSALNLSSSLAATLDWLASVPGSKSIVLISTGIDTSAPGYQHMVNEKLKTSDVRMLAVSIFGDFRQPPKGQKLTPDVRADRAFVKQGIAETDRWLQNLTSATGGRGYFPKNASDFQRAHAEIAQLVSGGYSLGFVPPELDGRIHSLRVNVKRSWRRVHHRQAYLALPSGANQP